MKVRKILCVCVCVCVCGNFTRVYFDNVVIDN